MQSVFFWILRRMLKYSAPLNRLLEVKKLRKYGQMAPGSAPLFIVGLPRSGSTLVYQVLTHMFNVTYIDNLMTLGRETLFFSAWLSQLFFRDRAHGSFTSAYGNTWESGLHAPSEAGALWYRWIPRELVYVDENSLTEKNKLSMTRNIWALINRYRKPLLIKNLYFSTRISLIRSLFPEAKFILVRRDPVYIAQSIYLSRLKNCKEPESEWWSVRFPGYEGFLGKPLEEQVARQVYELDTLLKKDLVGVEKESLFEIAYESLDNELIRGPLAEFLDSGYREGLDQASLDLKPSNDQRVDDQVFERLQNELDRCFAVKNDIDHE
ncbi:MAG: sulfotransferase [Bacteroidota bacterium]